MKCLSGMKGNFHFMYRSEKKREEKGRVIALFLICEISIPPNFTAERAETLEKPSGVWNTLKLCALCDLRVDK